MSQKYKNLLSPFKIGNVVLKNRLIASRSSPSYIQGSETYPTEALITHYANKAKNGMAIVTCGGVGMPHFVPEKKRATFIAKTVLPGSFDIYNGTCKRYLSQLTDTIHFYGGKASMQIGGYVPLQFDVSDESPEEVVFPGIKPRTREEIPVDVLDEVANDFVRQAIILKAVGFDMVYLHMAYRLTILGRFLSPLTNKRKDQYGGSVENRARFPIIVADRIKQACGNDFLIEASISGSGMPGGITLEDTIQYAKLFTGYIDLLQLRAAHIDPAHPNGFMSERTPYLYMAEAVKKSKVDIAVVTVGGYQDLDVCEDIIASGKADFIAMARGIISNPDYGRLAYEGKGEDVVPCIRCNLCLSASFSDPMVSVCSVNPTWGLEHKIERMIQPPTQRKKIAIIGGGPAGMKAALVAKERGHEVTLYEKSDTMGGLLKTTDNVSFKWPQRDFKNYLFRQVTKADIEVLLNTEVTPEMLRQENYDAVLASVGSEPIVPPIPGVDQKNVVFAPDVYGHEDSLSEKVIIIGGGEVGVETGMHLAEKGHSVTLLEMGGMLAPHAAPLHFYTLFKKAWEKLPNFNYFLRAYVKSIGTDHVVYTKADGSEQTIEAGTIVLSVGMKPKNDLALTFYGAADQFFMIGDCSVVGNIQKAIRSAFSTASML